MNTVMSIPNFSENAPRPPRQSRKGSDLPEDKMQPQVITKADYERLLMAVEQFQQLSKSFGGANTEEILKALNTSLFKSIGSAQIKMRADDVMKITRGAEDDEDINR